MGDLPASLFANPVWHALQTRHRHFAICAGDACRYPAEVTPFAAVVAPTAGALRQLHSLLSPGESLWLQGETYPFPPELTVEGVIECFQMVLPRSVALADVADPLPPLTNANADDMVALTDIAFPGFFRRRTNEIPARITVFGRAGN